MFGCRTTNQGNEIAQSVNKAFQVQVEIKKMRQGNPFAAISSKRDTVPMSLFPIQIHRADIMAKKVIGMGQFGEVYLALQVMKNKGEGKAELGNSLERAVKILRKSAGQADRMEFLREAEAMVKLTHPNLVQIIGVAVQQRPWLTVLEYIKYGDLLAVVKAAREKNFDISYTEQLVWGEQVREKKCRRHLPLSLPVPPPHTLSPPPPTSAHLHPPPPTNLSDLRLPLTLIPIPVPLLADGGWNEIYCVQAHDPHGPRRPQRPLGRAEPGQDC